MSASTSCDAACTAYVYDYDWELGGVDKIPKERNIDFQPAFYSLFGTTHQGDVIMEICFTRYFEVTHRQFCGQQGV